MTTELNFIDCNCPHCGEPASFPHTLAGLAQSCPNCMADLIAPEAEGSPARKLPLPLTTPKLVIRRLSSGDWKGLMETLGGEEEEKILQWLERDSHIKLTTPNEAFCLGLEQRESDKFLGYLGLRLTSARQATLNFVLHPEAEKTELPLEALKAVLGFCFRGIRLHRVSASLVSTDTAGIKRCEDAGMRREAVFVKDTETPEGEWLSSIWYALLQEEFPAVAAPPAS